MKPNTLSITIIMNRGIITYALILSQRVSLPSLPSWVSSASYFFQPHTLDTNRQTSMQPRGHQHMAAEAIQPVMQAVELGAAVVQPKEGLKLLMGPKPRETNMFAIYRL